ncbi:MAG: sulfotransferase [Solirubrobacteraceae bacterium]
MQVIGAGFGRTGTMSLKVALEELGAGPCLHSLEWAFDAERSPRALAAAGAPSHWQRLADGEEIDWRGALAGWGSVLDWVGARFYREMLDAWPQAKVILSVRDPDEWYESCSESLHATRELGASASASSRRVLDAVEDAIWRDVFGGRFRERAHAIAVFERHREEVIASVPGERLLIYDIRDGWDPLCRFLDVEIPQTPFPHLNSRAAFWTRLRGRSEGGAFAVAPPGLLRAPAPAGAAGGRAESAAPRTSPPAPQATAARSRRIAPAAAHATPAPAHIAGLALADPPRTYTQEQALQLLGLAHDEFARRIFARCGVQRRQLDLTPELLATTLQGRTHQVEEILLARSLEAIERLDIELSNVRTLVTSTLFSLGCPTLAHRLVEAARLQPDTDPYPVLGVGCASAVPLLRLAAKGLVADASGTALVVAAESMSGMLVGALQGDSKSKTVGSSIFGDGCAALLLDGGEDATGPAILASKVHQIPDSLHAVELSVAPHDSYLGLVRELPDVAGAQLRGLVDSFLAEHRLRREAIEHWIVHPGGRRILESAQEALQLPDEQVTISYDVLANHGNVGTPSIFYVLARTLERHRPRASEHGLLVTIGPGVTVGLMLLRF